MVPTVPEIDAILGVLSDLLPAQAALHEPEFAGNEWAYVKECLDTGWVSSAGQHIERFEGALCAFTGAAHAVATVNGTAALHTCLMLAGAEAGDEVIVPALTFVATANAISYMGAYPHFADNEERTLGLDAARLAAHLRETTEMKDGACVNRLSGRRISAIVCMHTFGHPVDLDALVDICGHFNIPLIEDAAESLGSYYKGRHTGNHARLSALSFNGNKIVTSGGGGAVLTNDKGLAAAAKHLTTTAKQPHAFEYIHDRIAYNYRLPNINAALGLAQMEQLPLKLKRKRSLAASYRDAFAGISGLRFFEEPENCQSNYWLNVLLLDKDRREMRDDIIQAVNAAGFGCRPAWRPMHLLEPYRDCPGMDLKVTEDLYGRIINIPSSPALAGNGKKSA